MNKPAIENIYLSFFDGGSITYISKDHYCIECSSGSKYWYLDNKLHRTDGPAIEFVDGERRWFLNGKRHRTDGPAFEYSSGAKGWWIDDKQHTERGYKAIIKAMK